MLNPKKLTAFIFLAYVLLTASCGRRGCTDKDAENYEPKAKRSCSCCFYYGKVRVRYTSNYYDSKIRDKIASIRVYIDGKLSKETKGPLSTVAGYSSDNFTSNYGYFVSTNERVIVAEKDLGNEKKQTADVVVTGNEGTVLWYGYVVFKANTIYIIDLQ